MTKTDLLELLNSTKIETLKFFDLTNEELKMTYGIDKWSVRQILHHLTDSEVIFQERLKKIIAEPKQVIWACNQDQWNEAFDYKNQALRNRKRAYELCREMNYELVEDYYDQYGAKEFIHSETGLRTLKMEFEKVALHNKSHNDQIGKALEK